MFLLFVEQVLVGVKYQDGTSQSPLWNFSGSRCFSQESEPLLLYQPRSRKDGVCPAVVPLWESCFQEYHQSAISLHRDWPNVHRAV